MAVMSKGGMTKPYYQDEWVTIYHGDCREILPELPKADLLLTDPPYGLNEIKNNPSRGKLAMSKDYGLGEWDKQCINANLLRLILSKAPLQIIWGGNYYSLSPAKCWLVWDKVNYGTDFADCELGWTNLNKATRLFQWQWAGMLQGDMKNKEYRWHPTQKPVALISWCLSLVPKAQLILDPFLGSGTTCYCAKKLNRKCIGIEIEEKYCEIAANRCRQMVFDFV